MQSLLLSLIITSLTLKSRFTSRGPDEKEDSSAQGQAPERKEKRDKKTPEPNSSSGPPAANELTSPLTEKRTPLGDLISVAYPLEDGDLRRSSNPRNGYIQVNWEGAGKFATLHQVLAWSRGLVAEGEEQVSHLCGKPACLIAEHVVIKNATQNNGRKGCGITVPCPHGDSCPLWITTCRHNPPCVSRAVGPDVERFQKETEGVTSMEEWVKKAHHNRI
ncbi:hypothetical protein FGSG_13495 [Fusarium graminearum PH-1]|uniref:hypothetical protein n=1 Tax=Gibberella zeae (strain ATCC MYA-4620 / CBS 123657 / FGSC 9075 / NRRL 31084 / PH-1) TaxID=229533 RepID=UPI00021F131D|nr:hypothetical protein FGSG_13495 [Fusarium graminearum PH-1]ESU15502.1 hypothetical protein FGSG_13495 [Fusarium graminearum PH-1]|eukprot:XP_011328814.1 hypothetical protein FGSG_13495 [Fusarium graminearum PH-1]